MSIKLKFIELWFATWVIKTLLFHFKTKLIFETLYNIEHRILLQLFQ